ncbi:unnamed protein product, partial [Ectocarpus sp. 4 AP-2014]
MEMNVREKKLCRHRGLVTTAVPAEHKKPPRAINHLGHRIRCRCRRPGQSKSASTAASRAEVLRRPLASPLQQQEFAATKNNPPGEAPEQAETRRLRRGEVAKSEKRVGRNNKNTEVW